jgi:hypothetical protein
MLEVALVAALDHLLLISFSVQGQLSQVNVDFECAKRQSQSTHPNRKRRG